MKCGQCGGEFLPFSGDLDWTEELAGRFVVPDVVCEKCDRCGEFLLPPEACRKIDAARAAKLEHWLGNLPLRDFWDSRQVTEFLGITRQALSKGVQYRNMIYRTERNGKHFYLAESVRRFKRTGDGRIRLEFKVETAVPRPRVSRSADYDDSRVLVVCDEPDCALPFVTVKEPEVAYA